jgi:hypothetical protein
VVQMGNKTVENLETIDALALKVDTT